MVLTDAEILRDLVRISRRAADLGYVVAGEGNTSARAADPGEFWIKRSGCSLGEVTESDFVRMDAGRAAEDPEHVEASVTERADERFRPSIEVPMHAILYRALPDASFVVHTHPPCTLAACCTEDPVAFLQPQFPDSVVYLGVPKKNWILLPYNSPGPRIADRLKESLGRLEGELRVVLLSNHGAITIGASAPEALARTQVLEKASYVRLMSSLGKGATFLGVEDVAFLENMEAEKYRQRVMKGKI
jgi:ribulose-5-phosphate 4-epimerase/fuculose-1-phosphate aldolase